MINLLANVMLAADSSSTESVAAMVYVIPFILIWLLWMLFIMVIWILIMVLVVGGSILWIFMLVDVAKRDFKKTDDKLVWIVILVLTGAVGAIIYYFMEYKKKKIKQ